MYAAMQCGIQGFTLSAKNIDVDLELTISIKELKIEVYENIDIEDKPLIGEKLNRPCTITYTTPRIKEIRNKELFESKIKKLCLE